MKQVSGNIVDIHSREIYAGTIFVEGDKIHHIEKANGTFSNFIIPGLIDSHVHIESSMLTPVEFSNIALKHGTVATVSDPHEIANVLGVDGVRFMIENGRQAPLKFHWGVPSCVPATSFETSGAVLDADNMEPLFLEPEVVCLAEMMNYPGVVYDDKDVLRKLALAKKLMKPIDGHAPGLRGDNLAKYVGSGISTDHECTTLEEALEKLSLGMHILIRNGSSARNFKALESLIDQYPDKVMLCCDDIHPDDLQLGHINAILRMGASDGLDIFNLLRSATLNPVKHYNLDVGLLRNGDYADFCIVDNLSAFNVKETWINGECVFKVGNDAQRIKYKTEPINSFKSWQVIKADIQIANEGRNFKSIEVLDGELLTKTRIIDNVFKNPFLESQTDLDVLKIIVVNRYIKSEPVVGFVSNFGMKRGAIASSVAHDSHNIISIGVNDEDILNAINSIMESKGGIVATLNSQYWALPLPVGGLMSLSPAKDVALKYQEIDRKVKEWGSTLTSPLMTLSFLALLVIPELKIGDKGLFDGNQFCFTSLFV